MKLLAEFKLPGIPKTINQMSGRHWVVRHNEAKRWKALVLLFCRQLRIEGLNLPVCRLELTRHSSREPDFDNMVGSWKHIIDGLVEAQVMIDDKPSVIGSPVFKWVKVPRDQVHVSVRIYELQEALLPCG